MNPLDAAYREHDIAYSRSSDLTDKHATDEVLARRALGRVVARDSTLGERATAAAVWAAMKAKTKIGMGMKAGNIEMGYLGICRDGVRWLLCKVNCKFGLMCIVLTAVIARQKCVDCVWTRLDKYVIHNDISRRKKMRNYKRRTNRASVPEDIVLRAVKGVVEEGESYTSMSNSYNIPRRSLVRYCTEYRNANETSTSIENKSFNVGYKNCSKQIFNATEEAKLEKYLMRCSDIYFGLSPKEVRKLAYQYAVVVKAKIPESWTKNMMAGPDWFSKFMIRHKKLRKCNITPNLPHQNSTSENIVATPIKYYTDSNIDNTGSNIKLNSNRDKNTPTYINKTEQNKQTTPKIIKNELCNAKITVLRSNVQNNLLNNHLQNTFSLEKSDSFSITNSPLKEFILLNSLTAISTSSETLVTNDISVVAVRTQNFHMSLLLMLMPENRWNGIIVPAITVVMVGVTVLDMIVAIMVAEVDVAVVAVVVAEYLPVLLLALARLARQA
ncbi:PREDICTED: uncharacterized protein LOC105457793 [Wasmannia auropunctata]|uniref:uncharacterized protein LOC105457793 n=1 Tax=Wasmannia auropunctata TaxID=64793 RepID=UPI0005EF849C|nr:PREDICTED: uncharacterized protein LOC105457793 [Wasmannia auropunctata]